MTIREWVEKTFAGPERKWIVELGAHRGEDTEWLTELPNTTMYAFEPDAENRRALIDRKTGAILVGYAVSDTNGQSWFTPSKTGWNREWTYSGSLLKPKTHLRRYPVTFAAPVMVDTIRLDSFFKEHGPNVIDFIWCDIQGAEAMMIRGAQETLRRTKYLYCEYSNEELYEGQKTLRECRELLPDWPAWEQIGIWPDDQQNGNVLFANRNLVSEEEHVYPQEVCA